jgi:hypothetical protein
MTVRDQLESPSAIGGIRTVTLPRANIEPVLVAIREENSTHELVEKARLR